MISIPSQTKKVEFMKKLYLLPFMMLAALSSCHNQDWEFDDYGTRSVYFAYQYPVRTITLGEDPSVDNSMDNEHKCKIMATTGGGYSNDNEITIGFEVDNSLCDGVNFKGTTNPIKAMPANYYKLSSDKIVISAGSITGGVEVQLTDAFFADPMSVKNTYVIPLRMTDVQGADTILQGRPLVDNPNTLVASDWNVVPKNYIMYCIKYINPWHAAYLRRGKDDITGKAGHEGLTQENVRHQYYVEDDEVCNLKTRSMNEVELPLNLKDESGNNISYSIVLQFDDNNNCIVKSAESDKYSVIGKGKFVAKGDKKSWGNEDRDVIYLDYEVDLPQLKCHTLDTLVVRNRGVVMEQFTPELQ